MISTHYQPLSPLDSPTNILSPRFFNVPLALPVKGLLDQFVLPSQINFILFIVHSAHSLFREYFAYEKVASPALVGLVCESSVGAKGLVPIVALLDTQAHIVRG